MKGSHSIRSNPHGVRPLPIIRYEIGRSEKFIQNVAAPYGTAGQLIDENRSLNPQIRATITWPEKNKEVLGRFGHFIAEGTLKIVLWWRWCPGKDSNLGPID